MKKKIKTSVSISPSVLKEVKKIAEKQDRSVSYVLEKFIESKVKETPDEPTTPKDNLGPTTKHRARRAGLRGVHYDGIK